MSLLLALALGLAASAADRAGPVNAAQGAPAAAAADPEHDRFDQAVDLIGQGRPADAIPLLDSVIASLEASHARDASRFYCARSTAETIFYSALGAGEKKTTKVVDELWCNSYFFKGFALVDLGRKEEA